MRFVKLFAVAAMLALSGCSVQPLYVNEGQFSGVNMLLRYADPNSRLEQVAYQTISERIRKATGDAFPELEVRVNLRTQDVGRTLTPVAVDSDPRSTRVTRSAPWSRPERMVTARIVATVRAPDGNVLFNHTNEASALYRHEANILSRDEAADTARESAVRTAAEGVRLQLLIWGRHFNSDWL